MASEEEAGLGAQSERESSDWHGKALESRTCL